MTTTDVRCERHQGETFPPQCSECIALNNQANLERAHAEGGAAEAERRFGVNAAGVGATGAGAGQAEADRRFGQHRAGGDR